MGSDYSNLVSPISYTLFLAKLRTSREHEACKAEVDGVGLAQLFEWSP